MKPQFHEDYHSTHTDPLTETQSDFDWDALYAQLGEVSGDSFESPEQKLASALRRIFQWALNIEYTNNAAQLTPDILVGRRVIALAWVMNPDLFPGCPSLHQLSKRLCVTAPILATLTGEVCREFGIQNRAQAHAWNRTGKDERNKGEVDSL